MENGKGRLRGKGGATGGGGEKPETKNPILAPSPANVGLPYIGPISPLYGGPMSVNPILAPSPPYVGPCWPYGSLCEPLLALSPPYGGLSWPSGRLCWRYIGLSSPHVDPMLA